MDRMDEFKAVMIAEGVEPVATEKEYLAAWQELVNSGVAWKLQGFFGRTATALIKEGLILPPGHLDRNNPPSKV